MATKLTLRIDEELIDRAKKHARRSGGSVSQLVADYFSLLGSRSKQNRVRITPRVRSLKGILRGSDIKPDDHKKHLEKKHS